MATEHVYCTEQGFELDWVFCSNRRLVWITVFMWFNNRPLSLTLCVWDPDLLLVPVVGWLPSLRQLQYSGIQREAAHWEEGWFSRRKAKRDALAALPAGCRAGTGPQKGSRVSRRGAAPTAARSARGLCRCPNSAEWERWGEVWEGPGESPRRAEEGIPRGAGRAGQRVPQPCLPGAVSPGAGGREPVLVQVSLLAAFSLSLIYTQHV